MENVKPTDAVLSHAHPASFIGFTAGFLGNRFSDCVISSSSSHKDAIQEMLDALMDYRKKPNII